MQTFITDLARASRAETVRMTADLDAALTQLDNMMAGLARELQVEYYGPAIGIGEGRDVYRLVVRAHEWEIKQPSWSLKVCTALPHAQWRADWAVQGTSRQRKSLIVRALPAFFTGFAEAIAQAGKGDSSAGRRVQELARHFAAA